MEEVNPVQLDNLRWRPRFVSLMGCIKGCLEFLGSEVSWGWLYGGSGHAFVMNIHREVCPSGPTAWDSAVVSRLGRNLGFKAETICAIKNIDEDFEAAKQDAWEMVRWAIDHKMPCYGWELQIPEYYVICGYGEEGYLYSGALSDGVAGPKPWDKLGESAIGVVEVTRLEACEPAPPRQVVKEALEFAIRHAREPGPVREAYFPGLSGYEAWAAALEEGAALRLGLGYNAETWVECREEALSFLREAKNKLQAQSAGKWGARFDAAIDHYATVGSRLQTLADKYPFFAPKGEGPAQTEQVKDAQAARLVRDALAAERKGLEVLEEIHEAL